MLEKHIQLQILHYLKALGAYGGKTKTMGVKRGRAFCFDPYLLRGMPDLTFFWKSRLYFIEVKNDKGIQSPEQKTFQAHCEQAGITYLLARRLEDVSSVIH